MISIVITSFKEPETIGRAIESFLKQEINDDYELIVAAPDKETHEIVKDYSKKFKKVKLFIDPGKGKSYALNLLLPKLKGDFFIFTDGDVFVSQNSVNEIAKFFKDSKVGAVSGKPVPTNSTSTILGYWAKILCESAHKLRKKRNDSGKFLECSGYYWAFRNDIIKSFPKDVAEDTIVPMFFFLKGYKIKYADKAEVFVKYPQNFRDFIKQKKRAAASHGTVFRYVPIKKIPRMKTFFNELSESYSLFSYAKNPKEFFYTLLLFPARFYIWASLFYSQKFKNKYYVDGWKRIESTK